MAWGKAGSTTLEADDYKIDTTVSDSKFGMFLTHSLQDGTVDAKIQFGTDGTPSSSSYYSFHQRFNWGTEGVVASSTNIDVGVGGYSADSFHVGFFSNISGEQKLIWESMANLGTAITFAEQVGGKYNDGGTNLPLNVYRFNEGGTATDIATGSNSIVLGSDLIPTVGKPTNVQEGSRFEETDTRKIYYKFDANTYHSEVWYELGTAPYAGGRGVFGGGSDGSITNTMQYITIATPSNATDFGDLTVARTYVEAVSSITRGVFGGGYGSANEDTMDYITFATPSNATDFGNLTVARHALAGVSSGTRGVFGGGNGSNVMDYITIATPSNATDFGDLTVTRQDLAGVSSDTRGVFAGGDGSNVMDYITISTPSNATDFGDLLTNLRYPADVSNGTRGVFAGGDPNSGSGNTNVIQYITIATTGNATDFGDLTVGRHAPAGVESDTRGVIGGGYSGSNSNVMDYITIATTGNATDFGDLTAATNHLGGASRF